MTRMTDKDFKDQDQMLNPDTIQYALSIVKTDAGNSTSKTNTLPCLSRLSNKTSFTALDQTISWSNDSSDKNQYFTVQVSSGNMSPHYNYGDIVVCRLIKKYRWIEWGSICVLQTVQGIVIARIYKDEYGIRCVSFDREEYPDFIIPHDEIYSINVVIGTVRLGN